MRPKRVKCVSKRHYWIWMQNNVDWCKNCGCLRELGYIHVPGVYTNPEKLRRVDTNG